MKLLVQRGRSATDSMPGKMYVDGEYVCATLEDEYRLKKVRGETAISAGTYRVTLRSVGGFHERYKKAHPDMHVGMLWIRDVPSFEYILIHQGNTEKDTGGCILVGDEVVLAVGQYILRRSKVAYRRLYQIVSDALLAGDDVTVEIRNAP